MKNLTKIHETMKGLRFGVEIESVGLGRERLARTIATVVGGEVRYEGGGYDKWIVVAPDGRKWTAMRDGSLSGYESGEITTPILTYADMDNLQAIVRAVRAAGARVDSTCGIHVHVDGSSFTPRAVKALVRLCANREPMIEAMLGLRGTTRQRTYCRGVDERVAEGIRRCNTMSTIQRLWYGGNVDTYTTRDHYHSSRYHGVNLHSLFFRGTIEFRWFNGSLHAGEVKAYVQLVLAFAARALTTNQVWGKKEYDAATVLGFASGMLRRLGLVGDEFKNTREHLTKRLRTERVEGRRRARGAARTRARMARDLAATQTAGSNLAQTIQAERAQMVQAAAAAPATQVYAGGARTSYHANLAGDPQVEHDLALHDSFNGRCTERCPRGQWRLRNGYTIGGGIPLGADAANEQRARFTRATAQTDAQAAQVIRVEEQAQRLQEEVLGG